MRKQMNGAIIAFDPCHACESHDMCSMCELTLRRDGALRTDKWISVEDRLPDRSGKYLVFTLDKRMYLCDFIDHYCDGNMQFDDYRVTHWMPLPMPPKGDVEE